MTATPTTIHAPAAVPAAAKRGPRTVVVPDGITAARAAAATLASERITATLTASKSAAGNVIVKTWGADTTPAALRLAKRAADEISGASKSRGGARADVLAVVNMVEGDAFTPAAVVAAALARLADNAKAVADRRARKQGLADAVNDGSLGIRARQSALSVLAGMDDADADAKRLAAGKRLADALAAAVLAGVPLDTVATMTGDAYGFDTIPAADGTASVTWAERATVAA
jgi:hypothetical protein